MANTPPPAGTGGSSSTGYLSTIASRYAAAGGGIPTGGAGAEPQVWTGHTTGLLDPITGAPKPYSNTRKVGHPVSEVIGEMDKWTIKKKKELARRLAMAGYFGSPNVGESLDEFVASIPLADLEKAWQDVVMATAQKNANGVWVTPQQLIQQQIDYNKAAAQGTDREDWFAGKSSKADKPFSGTKSYTSISRDIFSASEARGLIRGVLQQELGRDPTEEEFQDFKDALNTEQRQNPSRTTESTVYREGDPIKSTSTTTGGIDPQEFALQQAQGNPDWAEWQAVGTYFPAAMNLMGAGVPGF